jgi:hypothetical protein
VKKRCANAMACAREARGSARGLEEDVAMRKQELALRRCAWRHGEARMAVMRHGGRKGGLAQGREGSGVGLWWHVAWPRAAQGWQGRHTWLGQRRRCAAKKTEERGREVDEGGPKSNLQKGEGPYCNA